MKRFSLIFSALVLISGIVQAQNLALGQWRVHLPYNKAKSIADAGDRIYCASEKGLFYYNRNDNSLNVMSKITGLSELSAGAIAYSNTMNVLVVCYTNANIDLVYKNSIVNIPDIKRKNITGDKNIYNITFRDHFAYLSCGFGIVQLDLERQEIKETFYIGPNGSEIRVYDIDFLGNDIYAATESGIFRADMNNPNLSNFNNWTVVLDDVGNIGDFTQIETFNNKIFTNYAKPNGINPTSGEFLMFDGNTWGTPPSPFISNTSVNYAFRSSNGSFYVTNGYSISVFDNSLNRTRYIDNAVYASPAPRDAYSDASGIIWVADNEQGLVKIDASNNEEFIIPDGPQSDLVSGLAASDKHVWVTHATRSSGWFNTYAQGSFSGFFNNDWKTYNNKTVTGTPFNINDYFDMMSLAIDPTNADHVFLGSKGQGVLEMLNGIPIASYRDTNSTLQVGIGNPTQCQAVGMGFDKDNNLWVLNSLAARPVNLRTTGGQWKSFSIPGIPGAPLFGDMTIDSYGQKWVNVIGNNAPLGTGLVVFSENGTYDDISDDKARFIGSGIGTGNLPSTDVRAITEDHDGEIWLGTAKGVAVVYSPSSVLTSNNYDAQQILIKQDGINQYLLESEVVTAIAVDGANRKWIGTEAGGVFLMSPDGTQKVLNFNESNSPLISNYIIAITIDQKTGEVYFGTNKGLISYKGDAIEGTGGCSDILVYPNPVRENYSGPIAIKGLVPNGSVKITDVSGNLVYETTSNGTQAIWYGKNFKGEKAHTGVYLVFSSDSDGTNTCVTKLLFIN